MPPQCVIERSTDYAAVRKLLTEPRTWRRIMGGGTVDPHFAVEPREGLEFITARETGSLLAVFLIERGREVHFAFAPSAWGRTLPIARAFLEWVWANTEYTRLVGPVPRYNRLALRLARAAGFEETGTAGALILLEIRKP